MQVKLTKEGAKQYFGTEKCAGVVINATKTEEYYDIQGTELIAAGADKTLVIHDVTYVFEEEEVEVVS